MLKIVTNGLENEKENITMRADKVTVCPQLEYHAQIWFYLSKNTEELEKKHISMARPIKNMRQLLYKRLELLSGKEMVGE